MKGIFAVCGASGNVGGYIAKKLIDKGEAVRVIGRSRERLRSLIDRGAEACIGDLQDLEFVIKAFKDVKAVFVLIPPNNLALDPKHFQSKVATNLVEGIKRNEIKNTIALSSIGAHLPSSTGIVLGLHELEEKLKALERANVLILRGGYFMENLRTHLRDIENLGIVSSSISPDVRFPVVSTRDIGELAYCRLILSDFNGFEIQECLGPSDMSFVELAKVLGKALGVNHLEYKVVSPEERLSNLISAGLSEGVAATYIELERAFNTGDIFKDYQRGPSNSSRTTFEEFSFDLARNLKEFPVFHI